MTNTLLAPFGGSRLDKKIHIREGVLEDKSYLVSWLKHPETLRWFPMCNDAEIEDAANYWISFANKGALLTAEYEGAVCGIINLYIQQEEKLKHHALLAIIVAEEMRGKGVGKALLQAIEERAKKLQIEILHLEVYDQNPAIYLYEKMGFIKFGEHAEFVRDKMRYVTKHCMQKIL